MKTRTATISQDENKEWRVEFNERENGIDFLKDDEVFGFGDEGFVLATASARVWCAVGRVDNRAGVKE